jgi:ubiquinone/menaquinone biosynthesis C-methylase UbiE
MAVRAATVLLFLFVSVSAGFAQRDEAEREKQERVADILVALGARDGAKIADLGSADGFYTLRIARAAAPSGRAYAVDIDAKALDRLRERAQKDEISNVELILGDAADPKLPAGEIDAVLIRNAYHEMPEYRSILGAVAKSLKAGGVLVVIEAIRDKNRTLSREAQVKEHNIAPEIVDSELRDAGFEIVERVDPFTTLTQPPGGFWMIRARRP